MMQGTALKVMFGIPSQSGRVVMDFASSYAMTISLLHSMGVDTGEILKLGCCYIDQARDEIIHNFLNTDATHLMFIDDDISWDARDVVKLLNCPHEAMCGMYPHRNDEARFTANLTGERDGNLIRASGVPAGFLMIRREALEKMVDGYPDLRYEAQDIHGKGTGQKVSALCHMHIEDGTYYREDIAFCRRLSKVADGVWIDPDIELSHWDGVKRYDHKFRDFIRGANLGRGFAHEGVSQPDAAGLQSRP